MQAGDRYKRDNCSMLQNRGPDSRDCANDSRGRVYPPVAVTHSSNSIQS